MTKFLNLNLIFSLFVCAFLFCGVNVAWAESKSIFSIEPSKDGDFANVTVEPNSFDLKNYINQSFDAIRQKNEAILEFNKKTRKTIADLDKSSKDSIEGNKEKIREFLRKGKSEKTGSDDSSEPGQDIKANDSAVVENVENRPHSEELKKLEKSEIKKIESENEAIERRKKFISYCLDNLRGYPYVTGGSSPKTGFDCSGVVQYAARKSLGIELPRTAQAMYNYSEKVSADEAVPGDLIFFMAGGKISHVGVFLGTDFSEDSFKDKVIFFNSASEPKHRSGTIISSLSEPYWKRHFYGYGRIIK